MNSREYKKHYNALNGERLDHVLAEIKANPSITKVSLINCRVSSIDVEKILEVLKGLPELTAIDFSHNYLHNRGADIFAGYLGFFPKLQELNLADNGIACSNLVSLVTKANSLDRPFTLILSKNQVNLAERQNIFFKKNSQLKLVIEPREEKISLSEKNGIRKTEMESMLIELSTHPVIKLKLDSQSLEDNDLKQIIEKIEKNQLSYLEELDINLSHMTDAGANLLISLSQTCPNLKITNRKLAELPPRTFEITDAKDTESFAKLGKTLSIVPVSTLKITNCGKLDLKTVVHLIEVTQAKYINELQLSGAEINNEDLPMIVDLIKKCPNLRILNLSDNKIGETGARILSQALPVAKLSFINLSGNCISIEGMMDILDTATRCSARVDLSRNVHNGKEIMQPVQPAKAEASPLVEQGMFGGWLKAVTNIFYPAAKPAPRV